MGFVSGLIIGIIMVSSIQIIWGFIYGIYKYMGYMIIGLFIMLYVLSVFTNGISDIEYSSFEWGLITGGFLSGFIRPYRLGKKHGKEIKQDWKRWRNKNKRLKH